MLNHRHQGAERKISRIVFSARLVVVVVAFSFYCLYSIYYNQLWTPRTHGRFGIDQDVPFTLLFALALTFLTGLLLGQLISILPKPMGLRCGQNQNFDILALIDFLCALILAALTMAHDFGIRLGPIAYTLAMLAIISAFINFFVHRPDSPFQFLRPLILLSFFLLMFYARLHFLGGNDISADSIPERPTVILARALSLIGVGLYLQWGTFRRRNAFHIAGVASVLISLVLYFGATIELVSGSVGRVSHGNLEAAFYSTSLDILRVALLYMETAITLAVGTLVIGCRSRH